MGASQIPAGSALPSWVQLASVTASGSAVSFTSLTEYRNYKVSYFNILSDLGTAVYLTFNNDTGSNYAWINIRDSGTINSSALSNQIEISPGISSIAGASGVVTIADANQVIKEIDYFAGTGNSSDASNGEAFWNNTGVINRIDVRASGTTFTGGTIKVYGRN